MSKERRAAWGLVLSAGVLCVLAAILSTPASSRAAPFARVIKGLNQGQAAAEAKLNAEPSLPRWAPVPVDTDPLVRMPGTQPQQNVVLEGPGGCLSCHSDYDPVTEPGSNWQGSMMAQAGRDFLYWAALTVAAQDAIWAVGTPNATDICLRCHMLGGWLGGRSDPTNGSLMSGIDFDGVHCNVCHYMYDPFFEATYDGSREGDDWAGYWDETNASSTPSDTAAISTYSLDTTLASAISYFNGDPYFVNARPPVTYTESAGGQLFISTLPDDRRASFSDAHAAHPFQYSRFHKSKFFCGSCHDISNPLLQNLGADPSDPLPSETDPAFSYYHVERTFSEFMLSDYGRQGGAPGIGPFAPDVLDTSKPGNAIASCQDCHMVDVAGKACNMMPSIDRPAGSQEHPNSGVPSHDLAGGNLWVSAILASTHESSAIYDPMNDALLNQGPSVLTLDMTAGEGFDPTALISGLERAQEMLVRSAAIEAVNYATDEGRLSLRLQNNTGHKLISGYPEGRRMFLNIKYFDGPTLLYEVNPYDFAAGTLKGLTGYSYSDPDGIIPAPAALGPNELYLDELVYEMRGGSTITAEQETFHFTLNTHRYKDNRIPPKGFHAADAAERLSEPIWEGSPAIDYFSPDEYLGGYDTLALDELGVIVSGADRIEITLYYQTTSREYIEFLRDEINGSGTLTLTGTGAGGDPPYIIQSDPFFDQLKAWGDTIWELWRHNMDRAGGAPVVMAVITQPVTLTNNPPIASADFYLVDAGTALTITAANGVLANDIDWDGDNLTAFLYPTAMSGELLFSQDGSFSYVPADGFEGIERFVYRAYDGQQLSEPVIVTIGVGYGPSLTYLPLAVRPS